MRYRLMHFLLLSSRNDQLRISSKAEGSLSKVAFWVSFRERKGTSSNIYTIDTEGCGYRRAKCKD